MATYYITLEVRVKKALGSKQQDELRDAILEAVDVGVDADIVPYEADAVTATICGEEA